MGDIELIKVEKVDEKLIKEIIRRVVNAVNPLRIILFGSWAYGKPHKSSDIDLLVVVDDGVISRYEAAVKAYGALRGILITKDIVVATPKQIDEWENVPQAFLTAVINKGKMIYERKD